MKNQCYLVHKNGQGVLIDPAWDYKLINSFIIRNGLELLGVLLTHSHPDHTNLADRFARNHDIPVYMSQIEIDFYNFRCHHLQAIQHLNFISLSPFSIIPLHTPGHTAGGTCYLIENSLFTGDTVFIEGVGICSEYGGDIDEMYDTIQYLKTTLSDKTLIWPGHSFGQIPGKELSFLKGQNIYFQFDNREHFTKLRMRKGQSNPFNFK